MDDNEDPRDLRRKIEQASRIAASVTDQTTYERLTAWVGDLNKRCKSAWLLGDPRKLSERAPMSFGYSTDARVAGTWSSGCG